MGTDTHTRNFFGKSGNFGVPGAPLEPICATPILSSSSVVPVSPSAGVETGTGLEPASGGEPCTAALFVSTGLELWWTDRQHLFARDVQINATAYRRLDPEYYAWLRSKMNLAKLASKAGQLGLEDFNALREKFNRLHAWALDRFGEGALLEAVRDLDARAYRPPVAETDKPIRPACTAESLPEEATAMVDAIRDQALALGWTDESLYGTDGSTRPAHARKSGLVGFLKPRDQIGEVTPHSIEIVRPNGVRQRFYNPNVEQPWIKRLR